VKSQQIYEVVAPETQEMLNWLVRRVGDRKEEIVDMLSNDEPAKSQEVSSAFTACTWFDGCYYCQDQNKQWYQVKCYI
jgi:hypothetical protein